MKPIMNLDDVEFDDHLGRRLATGGFRHQRRRGQFGLHRLALRRAEVARLGGRVAALELMADLCRAIARQQQGQRPRPREPLAQVGKADPRLILAPARRLDEGDQVALDLEIAADVAPKQMVEGGPTE